MKKLLFFLMVAIPILVILIVKLTASVAVGNVFVAVQSVTLNETSISGKVGEEKDLYATVYPEVATEKEVFWSSKPEGIVTVEDGHVTFEDIGSGYITASTKDGNKIAQCSFYVWDTVVHKIEISAPANYIHIGKTMQLSVNVLPYEADNKEIIFSSSDESIASVDPNGLVTAYQKEENVEITATTLDGVFTDTINLSVIKPVTAIIVDQEEIITSSQNVRMEYIIEPFDATNKNVTFTIDKPEIASVDNSGLITFLMPGEVNITVSTVDGNFSRKVKYIYTGGYAYDLILSTSAINMQLSDDPIHIEYTTLPNILKKTKVEYSSQNENIAYVDAGGYLHAVSCGSTIITLSVQSSEKNIIKKQISVTVYSPAKEILIEDGMTALSTYQLEPKSLPVGSEIAAYFYHISDTSKATVSETGLVVFSSSTPCAVTVTIYANSDYSDVSKEVNIIYTAGRAGAFKLLEKDIYMVYGDTTALSYEVLPTNTSIKPMTITVQEEMPLLAGGKVIEVLADGRLRAIGGGSAIIKVSFVLYDETVVEEFCNITVFRAATDIKINLDLDYYQNTYITSEQTVPFSATVLPLDATDKNIIWSVDDASMALIIENVLVFNRTGIVTLTATVGNISNHVEIYYAGSNPVFAQVEAVMDGEHIPVPEKILVGQSFEIEISKIIPRYTTMPQISIQEVNNRTLGELEKVVEIDGNKITGVSGGTATFIVYISSSLTMNFSIIVERKPKEISVLQANTQVATDTVELISEVLPYDTTNKSVRYIVAETDIATIEGSTLIFKQNGRVNITAICEADESVRIEFYIEKIEKDMVYLDLEDGETSVNKGGLVAFNSFDKLTIQIEENHPIISGEQVLKQEGNYLRATAAGKAIILVSTAEKQCRIEISVEQLVEEIWFNSQADYFNDEYVFGRDVIDLDFTVYPSFAVNKQYSVSIIKSVSFEGKEEQIAIISGKQIFFKKAGSVTLIVKSLDGNCTKILKFRYTGGDAIVAELNVEDDLVMKLGDEIKIDVVKWLPSDAINTRISIREVNASGKKIIQINAKTRTIVAVGNGETKLVVELSSGIIKEIRIICVSQAVDIQAEEDVLTASDFYTIEATVIPKEVSADVLEFTLEDTDIATIVNNVLHFYKAGTVRVHIRTSDGSNLEKVVTITSTCGYLGKIVLNRDSLQLSKGEMFNLFVDKYPVGATEKTNVKFKIISQSALNGDYAVIELTPSGQITALRGGVAIVRAYAEDYYGNEIYADCQILVVSPLEYIDVQFETELEHYNNGFVTSQSEIEFVIKYFPEDAVINTYSTIISEPTRAKVEGNKIIFMQEGRVTITFVCTDLLATRTKSYNFEYSKNLLKVSLDRSGIQNNYIYLRVGESFSFKLSQKTPNDNTDKLVFSINGIHERRNDTNKEVAIFEDGVLYAKNGGSYSFTMLSVNGLQLLGENEVITLIVTRDPIDIELDGSENVYISTPNYKIFAHVLESDANQSIGFECNSTIARVDAVGNVIFNDFGECDIKVYCLENKDIFIIVHIRYTQDIQAIAFNTTIEDLYVKTYLYLSVYAQPSTAEFEYIMSIDRQDIASLEKKDNGYKLTGLKEGDVVVTAKVLGKDISISKTFHVHDQIISLSLELDKTGDEVGLGKYRVFGTRFINGTEIVNTYQMNVITNPVNSPKDGFEWTSSSDQIATVDQNGIVTFLQAGRVTITVKQKALYEGAPVLSDSYEFVVVDGINVSNYQEFKVAHVALAGLNTGKTSDLAALVLHDDIMIEKDSITNPAFILIDYNIYGNGKILNLTVSQSSWERFVIRRDGVILDNVTLHGTDYSDPVELQKKGETLLIENCKDILVYNCYIEAGNDGIRTQNATVSMAGCIFRNCLAVGVKLGRTEAGASHANVKDCIFTGSCIGIMFPLDKLNLKEESTLNLEGEVRFYNWSTMSQLKESIDLGSMLGTINEDLKAVADKLFDRALKFGEEKGKDYVQTYNGQKYFDFGVFKAAAKVTGLGVNFERSSSGTVTRNRLDQSCNYYSDLIFDGLISIAIYDIYATCEILSIKAKNAANFIKPGDDYMDNFSLISKIRQKCMF